MAAAGDLWSDAQAAQRAKKNSAVIKNWDDFFEQAKQLYEARPSRTRYTMKYRHCDGKMILKVTDDVKVIQFKTDEQRSIRQIEKLNNWFFATMTRNG